MAQPRDAHGRFAKRRLPDEVWASQVRAAHAAAGIRVRAANPPPLNVRQAQQRHERDLRTGLRKRRQCEDVLRNLAPGREGERRLFLLPLSVAFRVHDEAVCEAPRTFEAIYVHPRWRPILDTHDRANAARFEAKRADRGPFARALSDEMRRCNQEIRAAGERRLFGLDPILGRAGDLVIKDDPMNAKVNFQQWQAQQQPAEPAAPPWERKPEDRPYGWWARLPFCDDDALNAALDRAVRRAHPHWKRIYYSNLFRLALLGGGSFRDCFHVLTVDGYDTGLIVKRPTRNRRDHVHHGLCDLAYDQGNGQEATVYLHLADVNPDALACFPVLYETEPVYGDWAIHEKVRPECQGKENLRDLEGRWRSAGVDGGDLHPGNVGRRDSDRCTLVIDWGHFTVRDLHDVSHRARF